VLLNLIMNGVEAMSAADTVVDVSRELVIASHRAGPETVLVEVRDSGVGFDPESMPKLFDPFFTTKAGSIGMGLSISRSIVDAHGGRLWVTPNLDRGATLRFTLPIARDGSTGS
jgi:signal transduction histidine kinase